MSLPRGAPRIQIVPDLQNREVVCGDKEGLFQGTTITCYCCNLAYSPSDFEKHTGSTRHRPWQYILVKETGKSILQYRTQPLDKRKKKKKTGKRLSLERALDADSSYENHSSGNEEDHEFEVTTRKAKLEAVAYYPHSHSHLPAQLLVRLPLQLAANISESLQLVATPTSADVPEKPLEDEVERIVAKKEQIGQTFYYVKWKGYVEYMWEAASLLRAFPEKIRQFESQVSELRTAQLLTTPPASGFSTLAPAPFTAASLSVPSAPSFHLVDQDPALLYPGLPFKESLKITITTEWDNADIQLDPENENLLGNESELFQRFDTPLCDQSDIYPILTLKTVPFF